MSILLAPNFSRELIHFKYILLKSSLSAFHRIKPATSGEHRDQQNMLIKTEFVSPLCYFRHKHPLNSTEMNLNNISEAPPATYALFIMQGEVSKINNVIKKQL